MSDHPDRHEAEDAGDPACRLERVCRECGALTGGELPACWRCSTPVVPS